MKKLGSLFLQGFIAILPIALTVYLVYWLAASAESVLGKAMKFVIGADYYIPGLGVLAGFLITLGIGMLLRIWLFRKVFSLGETLLQRIPGIKSLYGSIRDGTAVTVMMRMAKSRLFTVSDFHSWVYALGSFFIPLLVVFLSLSLFYRLAPRRPTQFAQVWVAASCATVLLRSAESLFVVYLKNFATLNAVYGGVRRDHGLVAVDLPFRVHLHLRRLPVRCSGRRAFSARGNNDGVLKEGELNHDDNNSLPGTGP